MLPLILLLHLIPWKSNAQVTEINFLGKIWHVHGIDQRLRITQYASEYYLEMYKNVSYPNNEYKNYYQGYTYLHFEPRFINLHKSHSIGVVFRPFSRTGSNILRTFEFSHNLELDYKMVSIFSSWPRNSTYDESSQQTVLQYYSLGYNPGIHISSPAFWDGMKLYAIIDAQINAPLRSYLYINPPFEISITNEKFSYKRGQYNYSERLPINFFSFGYGLGLGVKQYITCSWNFHVEARVSQFHTSFTQSNSSLNSNRYGVYVGLRYKFGYSDEEEKEGSGSGVPLFW